MDETNTEVVKDPPHSTDIQGGFLETKVIGISGMTCDKCVQTIEQALKGKHGVEKVQVNREAATATVTWDRKQTNLPELHEILLKSGYKPTGGVVE